MWNTLYKLFNNKTATKEEIEKIPSYIMIRWLSGNKLTVIPANIINLNYNIPIYNQYKFLDDYYTLTGINKKISKIKYNKDIKETEIIENIAKYYKVNLWTAKKYYNLMPEDERKSFKDLYKEGKV